MCVVLFGFVDWVFVSFGNDGLIMLFCLMFCCCCFCLVMLCCCCFGFVVWLCCLGLLFRFVVFWWFLFFVLPFGFMDLALLCLFVLVCVVLVSSFGFAVSGLISFCCLGFDFSFVCLVCDVWFCCFGFLVMVLLSWCCCLALLFRPRCCEFAVLGFVVWLCCLVMLFWFCCLLLVVGLGVYVLFVFFVAWFCCFGFVVWL